ncbi:MAG TPA: outer membrane beta-barrel protein [Steroidobacteraceae bacterium]|nr:outer membrane beta-barrel protein [Steroidobacteraceae bacterium]
MMELRGVASCRAAFAVCLLISLRSALAADQRLGVPVAGSITDTARQAVALSSDTTDQTRLDVSASVGETDNIARMDGGPSQTVGVIGVDFGLKRTGRRFDTDLKGDFNYIDYLQSYYGSEVTGRFDGAAGWEIVPERLRWSVEDSFGQAQLQPFSAVTPDNLENVNVVSTGPDLLLRPTQSLFVKLGGRYAYAHYETNPFDNRRLMGNFALGHDLSGHSSIALNGDFQSIRFTNTIVNSDYDRRNFYASYLARGSRTDLSVDAGVSQSNDGGSWRTTPFVRIEATRVVSTASVLKVIASRQYSDASDSFRSLQAGATGRIVVAPVSGTTSTYLDEYGTVLWSFERSRTMIDLSGTYERNTYATDHAQDVSRASVEARVARRMTSTLTAEVSGRAARERFLETDFHDRDYLASVAVAYRAGRRLEFKLRYDHERRSVSAGTSGYTENRGLVTVSYQVKP